MRSVSLRLQSVNQKKLTDYQMQRSLLHGFVFDFFLFDLSFDFLFDCTLQDKRDFRRFFLLILSAY